MTGTGFVLVTMPANSVHSAGAGNAASTGTTNNVFFDVTPPVISLVNPTTGSSDTTDTALNSRGYIDVSYSNTSSITAIRGSPFRGTASLCRA